MVSWARGATGSRQDDFNDRFIVLEGLDGAGTTTQLSLLAEAFRAAGIPVFATFEPTDNQVGLLIRRILAREITVTAGTMARLFVADRFEHVFEPENGILSRLDRGEYVICDRYLFSSLAYQSLGCGYETVSGLNASFPLPGVCVFLDVPPEECQKRMHGRAQVELYDELPIQQGILANYERALQEFEEAGGSLLRLDGKLPKESLLSEIWSFVRKRPIGEM